MLVSKGWNKRNGHPRQMLYIVGNTYGKEKLNMANFIEITKVNSYGEEGKALIRTTDIIGIKQKHVEGTKLYDSEGNVVQETPATTKDFQVLVASEFGRETYHVNETEYAKLVKLLTTDTSTNNT